MSDEKWREWVEWRLNSDPRPTGTTTQRRLGAAEVLLDMLLKVTPPEKHDVIVTLVETAASQGKPHGTAHMWLLNAWAADMQRQMNGEPRRLECASVDDSEAAYLTEHAIGLLGMYANNADPGAIEGISSAVSHQILRQPRLQGLSEEEISNKLSIKDAYLMQGIEAHALSLDLLSILTDAEGKMDLARRAVHAKRVSSVIPPAPARKKKWWQV